MTGQFQLPLGFDLGATFLFALTGAWVAIRRDYDFIGVFTLAPVTGVGRAACCTMRYSSGTSIRR